MGFVAIAAWCELYLLLLLQVLLGWDIYCACDFGTQANKEKISFGCLEIHEIAAFVLTPAGHYEAITRNCSNYYYLSAESVALFTDHLPSRPNYIVGQIVHVEHQIVKAMPSSSSEQGRAHEKGTDWLTLNSGSTTPNPFGLPVGCEYFVVTVAMLPDTTIHSSSPSWSLLHPLGRLDMMEEFNCT